MLPPKILLLLPLLYEVSSELIDNSQRTLQPDRVKKTIENSQHETVPHARQAVMAQSEGCPYSASNPVPVGGDPILSNCPYQTRNPHAHDDDAAIMEDRSGSQRSSKTLTSQGNNAFINQWFRNSVGSDSRGEILRRNGADLEEIPAGQPVNEPVPLQQEPSFQSPQFNSVMGKMHDLQERPEFWDILPDVDDPNSGEILFTPIEFSDDVPDSHLREATVHFPKKKVSIKKKVYIKHKYGKSAEDLESTDGPQKIPQNPMVLQPLGEGMVDFFKKVGNTYENVQKLINTPSDKYEIPNPNKNKHFDLTNNHERPDISNPLHTNFGGFDPNFNKNFGNLNQQPIIPNMIDQNRFPPLNHQHMQNIPNRIDSSVLSHLPRRDHLSDIRNINNFESSSVFGGDALRNIPQTNNGFGNFHPESRPSNFNNQGILHNEENQPSRVLNRRIEDNGFSHATNQPNLNMDRRIDGNFFNTPSEMSQISNIKNLNSGGLDAFRDGLSKNTHQTNTGVVTGLDNRHQINTPVTHGDDGISEIIFRGKNVQKILDGHFGSASSTSKQDVVPKSEHIQESKIPDAVRDTSSHSSQSVNHRSKDNPEKIHIDLRFPDELSNNKKDKSHQVNDTRKNISAKNQQEFKSPIVGKAMFQEFPTQPTASNGPLGSLWLHSAEQEMLTRQEEQKFLRRYFSGDLQEREGDAEEKADLFTELGFDELNRRNMDRYLNGRGLDRHINAPGKTGFSDVHGHKISHQGFPSNGHFIPVHIEGSGVQSHVPSGHVSRGHVSDSHVVPVHEFSGIHNQGPTHSGSATNGFFRDSGKVPTQAEELETKQLTNSKFDGALFTSEAQNGNFKRNQKLESEIHNTQQLLRDQGVQLLTAKDSNSFNNNLPETQAESYVAKDDNDNTRSNQDADRRNAMELIQVSDQLRDENGFQSESGNKQANDKQTVDRNILNFVLKLEKGRPGSAVIPSIPRQSEDTISVDPESNNDSHIKDAIVGKVLSKPTIKSATTPLTEETNRGQFQGQMEFSTKPQDSIVGKALEGSTVQVDKVDPMMEDLARSLKFHQDILNPPENPRDAGDEFLSMYFSMPNLPRTATAQGIEKPRTLKVLTDDEWNQMYYRHVTDRRHRHKSWEDDLKYINRSIKDIVAREADIEARNADLSRRQSTSEEEAKGRAELPDLSDKDWEKIMHVHFHDPKHVHESWDEDLRLIGYTPVVPTTIKIVTTTSEEQNRDEFQGLIEGKLLYNATAYKGASANERVEMIQETTDKIGNQVNVRDSVLTDSSETETKDTRLNLGKGSVTKWHTIDNEEPFIVSQSLSKPNELNNLSDEDWEKLKSVHFHDPNHVHISWDEDLKLAAIHPQETRTKTAKTSLAQEKIRDQFYDQMKLAISTTQESIVSKSLESSTVLPLKVRIHELAPFFKYQQDFMNPPEDPRDAGDEFLSLYFSQPDVPRTATAQRIEKPRILKALTDDEWDHLYYRHVTDRRHRHVSWEDDLKYINISAKDIVAREVDMEARNADMLRRQSNSGGESKIRAELPDLSDEDWEKIMHVHFHDLKHVHESWDEDLRLIGYTPVVTTTIRIVTTTSEEQNRDEFQGLIEGKLLYNATAYKGASANERVKMIQESIDKTSDQGNLKESVLGSKSDQTLWVGNAKESDAEARYADLSTRQSAESAKKPAELPDLSDEDWLKIVHVHFHDPKHVHESWDEDLRLIGYIFPTTMRIVTTTSEEQNRDEFQGLIEGKLLYNATAYKGASANERVEMIQQSTDEIKNRGNFKESSLGSMSDQNSLMRNAKESDAEARYADLSRRQSAEGAKKPAELPDLSDEDWLKIVHVHFHDPKHVHESWDEDLRLIGYIFPTTMRIVTTTSEEQNRDEFQGLIEGKLLYNATAYKGASANERVEMIQQSTDEIKNQGNFKESSLGSMSDQNPLMRNAKESDAEARYADLSRRQSAEGAKKPAELPDLSDEDWLKIVHVHFHDPKHVHESWDEDLRLIGYIFPTTMRIVTTTSEEQNRDEFQGLIEGKLLYNATAYKGASANERVEMIQQSTDEIKNQGNFKESSLGSMSDQNPLMRNAHQETSQSDDEVSVLKEPVPGKLESKPQELVDLLDEEYNKVLAVHFLDPNHEHVSWKDDIVLAGIDLEGRRTAENVLGRLSEKGNELQFKNQMNLESFPAKQDSIVGSGTERLFTSSLDRRQSGSATETKQPEELQHLSREEWDRLLYVHLTDPKHVHRSWTDDLRLIGLEPIEATTLKIVTTTSEEQNRREFEHLMVNSFSRNSNANAAQLFTSSLDSRQSGSATEPKQPEELQHLSQKEWDRLLYAHLTDPRHVHRSWTDDLRLIGLEPIEATTLKIVTTASEEQNRQKFQHLIEKSFPRNSNTETRTPLNDVNQRANSEPILENKNRQRFQIKNIEMESEHPSPAFSTANANERTSQLKEEEGHYWIEAPLPAQAVPRENMLQQKMISKSKSSKKAVVFDKTSLKIDSNKDEQILKESKNDFKREASVFPKFRDSTLVKTHIVYPEILTKSESQDFIPPQTEVLSSKIEYASNKPSLYLLRVDDNNNNKYKYLLEKQSEKTSSSEAKKPESALLVDHLPNLGNEKDAGFSTHHMQNNELKVIRKTRSFETKKAPDIKETKIVNSTADPLPITLESLESSSNKSKDVLQSPYLFQIPENRESYQHSMYYRDAADPGAASFDYLRNFNKQKLRNSFRKNNAHKETSTSSNSDLKTSFDTSIEKTKNSNKNSTQNNESMHSRQSSVYAAANYFADMAIGEMIQQEINSSMQNNKKKRSVPLIKLITDPKYKVDVSKTIENIGAATRNVFEDQTSPLYHFRNLVGSSKNVLLSILRIPPQNLVVPSNYEIDKIQDKDVVSEVLYPSSEEVEAINPQMLSRFGKSSEDVDDMRTSGEDPLQIIDTFHRIGAVLRESVKSGQDTLKHIGDVAQDARNIIYTTQNAIPKIEIPYTHDPTAKRRLGVTLPRSKTIILTPRILDIKKTRGLGRNPMDFRPEFVKMGQIMDAVGVSKPKPKALGLDKIILERTSKPFPELRASLSNFNPRNHNLHGNTVGQALETLSDVKHSTGTNTAKDFLNKMRNELSKKERVFRVKGKITQDNKQNIKPNNIYKKIYGNSAESLENEDKSEDEEINQFLEELISSPVTKDKPFGNRFKFNIDDKQNQQIDLTNKNSKALGVDTKKPFLRLRLAANKNNPNRENNIRKEHTHRDWNNQEVYKKNYRDYLNYWKNNVSRMSKLRPHAINKRSPESSVEIVEVNENQPQIVSNIKEANRGKVRDRIFLTHLEPHEIFPNDGDMEEIVGVRFFSNPTILTPFMGRGSEKDLEQYIEELNSHYSNTRSNQKAENQQTKPRHFEKSMKPRPNIAHSLFRQPNIKNLHGQKSGLLTGQNINKKTPEDLKGAELDHVLGAINPLMFEEYFNDTLPTGEKVYNKPIKVSKNGANKATENGERLGTMQLLEGLMKPFMGMAQNDALTDLLDTYNPQEGINGYADEMFEDSFVDYPVF